MRLPIVPFIIAATLLSAVFYLFTSMSGPGRRMLDVPRLNRLADIEGIETEVAIAPEGNRYAVVSDGDLWILDSAAASRQQVTHTPEAETFPNWTPDGKKVTFSRGPDTFVLNVDSKSEELFRNDTTSLSWSA